MKYLTALILALIVCGAAYSKPPAPSARNAAAQKQGYTENANKSAAISHDISSFAPSIIGISPASVLQIEASDKEEKRHGYSSSEWWLVYLTATLSLFTGLLFLFTFRLWSSTAKLVTGAEDTAMRQLRAYVLLEKVGMVINDAGVATFTIEISNSGQTPAYEVQSWFQVEIREFPLSGELKKGIAESKTVLGPKFVNRDFVEGPRPFTNAEIASIINGVKAIYVSGEISYFDIFRKEPRITKYRFICKGSSFNKRILPACADGNEAT